jgi:hypothetical protein
MTAALPCRSKRMSMSGARLLAPGPGGRGKLTGVAERCEVLVESKGDGRAGFRYNSLQAAISGKPS